MGFRMNADKITTNYTQTLSEFLVNLKYEDIPADVRERAKLIAIQTLGAGLATKGTAIGNKAVSIGKACGAGEPSATLWTDGSKVSMAGAAYTAGTITDALDWEDCSWVGHPSASIVPVSIIVAEALKKSGKDVITSIVAAYETSQRIAMVVQPDPDWDFMNGWGLTSWQIFAAVAPAAKLMDLTPEQVNQAFGFGALCCPIQSQLHHITMSDAYHYEHGFRTKDGILCAMTAKAGVDNYMDVFDDTYSWDYHMCPHPKRDWYTKDLGRYWLTNETLLKHWPANMWVQTPLELADVIHRKYGVNAEDIEEIIIDPQTDNRMFYDPKGYSALTQAQFSTPFMLATYFLNPDHPGKNWVSEDKLTDPAILELAGRVHGGPTVPHDQPGISFDMFRKNDYPMKTMTIRTKDGKVYTESLARHPGHPRNMMTLEQVLERFKVQAEPTLKGDKLDRAVEFLAHLEDVEDMSAISEFLS